MVGTEKAQTLINKLGCFHYVWQRGGQVKFGGDPKEEEEEEEEEEKEEEK
jgi:hypothetical protein